jgi:Pyrimidine 5'-nucleotidase (UMPH-1)
MHQRSHKYAAHAWAQALKAKYYPLELDESLSYAQRVAFMEEWVTQAHDALASAGLTRAKIETVSQPAPLPYLWWLQRPQLAVRYSVALPYSVRTHIWAASLCCGHGLLCKRAQQIQLLLRR